MNSSVLPFELRWITKLHSSTRTIGQNAKFNCTIEANVHNIEWHNNGILFPLEESRISVKDNVTTYDNFVCS